MTHAADRLDHYAHLLRRLHDSEFGPGWRHESRQDTPRLIGRQLRARGWADPVEPPRSVR